MMLVNGVVFFSEFWKVVIITEILFIRVYEFFISGWEEISI